MLCSTAILDPTDFSVQLFTSPPQFDSSEDLERRSYFCWSCSAVQHVVKLFSSVVKNSLLGPNAEACSVQQQFRIDPTYFVQLFTSPPYFDSSQDLLLVMQRTAAYWKTFQLHRQEFFPCDTTWSQYRSMQQVKAINAVLNSTYGSTQVTSLCIFLPNQPSLVPHKILR